MNQNKNDIIQSVVENPEVLKGVLETQEAKTIIYERTTYQHTTETIENPLLPSPQEVAEYNKHIPNFGERVMAYVEKEQAMRHNATQENLKSAELGLWLGVFALIVITAFCVYLAYLGYPQYAAATMGGVLAAVVGIFVLDKKH